MAAVENWATRESIDKMLAKGWVEKGSERRDEEGRFLVELFHPDNHQVTFRSLPTPIEGQMEIPT